MVEHGCNSVELTKGPMVQLMKGSNSGCTLSLGLKSSESIRTIVLGAWLSFEYGLVNFQQLLRAITWNELEQNFCIKTQKDPSQLALISRESS